MEPTRLSDLIAQGAQITERGLRVAVTSDWTVSGEDRLSYATLVRLAECARELHFQRSIVPVADSPSLDSIVRSIRADFLAPLLVPGTVDIAAHVVQVGDRSFELLIRFQTCDHALAAEVTIINVFYDPVQRRSVPPPDAVRAQLIEECHGHA